MERYLNRLWLGQSREARRDLANPYEMHRTLTNLFDGRVLYRVEQRPRPYVLIQSNNLPDPSRLLPGYGQFTEAPRRLEPFFRQGTTYRFRLLASPSRQDHQRKRRAIRSASEQLEWLRFHLELGGLVPVASAVLESKPQVAYKNGMKIVNNAVLFEGLLRAESPEEAWRTLLRGIGPGKAFGLGMLSLAL